MSLFKVFNKDKEVRVSGLNTVGDTIEKTEIKVNWKLELEGIKSEYFTGDVEFVLNVEI